MQIAAAALFSVATPCGGRGPRNPQGVSHRKRGSGKSALPEGKATAKVDIYTVRSPLLGVLMKLLTGVLDHELLT